MKTIYNTIKVACVGMMAMAMTSCLDFSPEAQMNDDTVWKSASNFQLFANQFYSYTRDIQSGDPYQYAVSDGPHSDTRSDLMAEAKICGALPFSFSARSLSVSARFTLV